MFSIVIFIILYGLIGICVSGVVSQLDYEHFGIPNNKFPSFASEQCMLRKHVVIRNPDKYCLIWPIVIFFFIGFYIGIIRYRLKHKDDIDAYVLPFIDDKLPYNPPAIKYKPTFRFNWKSLKSLS